MQRTFIIRTVLLSFIAIIYMGMKEQVLGQATKNNSLESKMIASLNKSKELIESNQTNYVSAYKKLLADADKALNEGPFSVMDKKLVPPSGDKHDYLSLAPYFWPDPSKPDGKPYIRKDGQVNPETRGDFVDYSRKDKFFENLNTLSYAYFFSNNEKYSVKAIQLLKTWFIDPETRMNPNLNFGQGVPGVSTGRPFGIIEFGGIGGVIKSIEMLKYKNALSPELEKSMRSWLGEYATWLKNSIIGKAERNTTNNHGTHYDGQLIEILVYLNKIDEVKQILEGAKIKRIAAQIEPDGSQPHELARTKSFSYSSMNLRGLIKLAGFGQIYGVDLWNFETPDGRSIRKAIKFMVPFAKHPETWKYEQIAKFDDTARSFLQMAGSAASLFSDQELKQLVGED
jgi:hypothetical protein